MDQDFLQAYEDYYGAIPEGANTTLRLEFSANKEQIDLDRSSNIYGHTQPLDDNKKKMTFVVK